MINDNNMKNKLIFILLILLLATAFMFVADLRVDASEFTGTVSTGVNSGSVGGTVIAAPSALPVAGTYTSTQNVVLTANGATSIRYTTDGTEPSCSTETVYHVPIPVSQSLTIKAISCYPNDVSSPISTFDYIISLPISTPAASPTPAPAGGGGGGGGGFVPTPTPSPLSLSEEAKKVDINNDNKIDILDFNVIMVNWGAEGNNVADLNKDGKVDILDFNALMVFWS